MMLWLSVAFIEYTEYNKTGIPSHVRMHVQVLGPHLAGLENISRRFINNLVWDLILVCIDAPGDWL